MDAFTIIVLLVLFLVWGGFCFWWGRKPQQVKDTIHSIGDKIEEKIDDINKPKT